jgi:hypothetical protein
MLGHLDWRPEADMDTTTTAGTSADRPAVDIDAAVVASGLGLEIAEFRALMRDGHISSLCERGVGEDAGRYRLTFYYQKRRFRALTDRAGRVLHPLPIQSAGR